MASPLVRSLNSRIGLQKSQRLLKPCSMIHQQRRVVTQQTEVLQRSLHSQRTGVIRQAASSGAADESPVAKSDSSGDLKKTLVLGALFGLWYLFNIYFNVFNKQVLKAYPFPLTETLVQFAVGSVIAVTLWVTKLVKKPDITWDTIKDQILILAVVHTLGNTFTNLSLGAVAVSFTHTIKAMEPFFSVILSWIFLGQKSSPLVLLTLIPIVGGVAAASFSEASFNWLGFGSAMASNVTFQSRNVLSKKVMNKTTGPKLDNINIFGLITITSFFLLLIPAIALEGFHFYPEAMKQMGVLNPSAIIQKALYAGAFFHLYQQVSYMILSRVSPVTHSIGNCVKRVIVICCSVIIFKNPMSQQNMIGTAIALGGVFLYARAKQIKPKAA